jgi:uncharacterized protein (TIGR03437 family)
MFAKWAYIPALLVSCFMPLSARDIFVTPGSSSSTNTIGVYRADPLTSVGTITGPAGAFQVLRASATKFYVISRGTVDTVTVYEGTLPSLTQTKRFNLAEPATAAAISPDGRRVVVIANSVYIYDTANDTNLTPSGITAGTNPTSIAFSHDSSRAFVLSPTTQRLSGIDLATGTVASTATIPGGGSQVGAAPNGFIYVTATNSLIEFDPRTLTNTNTISLNAVPSQMAFTPDGKGAVLVNSNPVTGSSLIHVDLVRRTFVIAPPIGQGAVPEKVVVTDNNNAYTFSRQTGRLYSVRLTPGSDAPLALTLVNFGSVQVDGISEIATSNEVLAKYVFVITPIGLFRIDSNGTTVGPALIPSLGNLSVNSAPNTTGAATISVLNEVQSIPAGQNSLPLVARVTDAAGNPVANVPVTFTPNLTGSTIVNAMAATNNHGIAVAYVNPPSGLSAGSIIVTATATGVAVPGSFTVNIGSGSTGGTTSGALQVLTGSGQALPFSQTTQSQEPLSVIVRDAAGKPLPGVNIAWKVSEGSGTISPDVSLTDEKGVATANFVPSQINPGLSSQVNVITASTGTETVSLYVTTLASLGNVPGGPAGSLNSVAKQSSSAIIEGRAGETIAGAIAYDVYDQQGKRLPFIGIRVTTDEKDAAGNDVASCRGGTQLSDNAGIAVCDLVLGSFIGESQITVTVGSVRQDRYRIRILPGQASAIQIVSGNNQSGSPGQQLATPLLVEFKDAFGKLLTGIDVQWEVVTAGGAQLSQIGTKSDNNGRASAVVTLGTTPGPVQVRVRAGTATATFSLTINVAAGAIRKQAGGDNQSAAIGQAFAQPLSVLVLNAQQQPLAGTQVTFSVAPGSTGAVTLGSATATTNAQGIASTTVTAGATVGAVTIRAAIGTLAETFTLTVRGAGPGFTASSIVNAAGFQPGISPGSLAVINASGIAPDVRGTVTPTNVIGPLPLQLANVEVLFNNTIAAPILYVSNFNGQESVAIQVPFEVAPGSASVTIRVANGGSTTVNNVVIMPIKPGIFENVDASGRRFATATRPDGSYVSAANPARRGEIIRVYATGLGQTTPGTGTNRAGALDVAQNVSASVIVGVNNEGVRVVSAQLLPGSIGVYVVAFEVPANTTPGAAQPFAIAAVGSDGVTVFGNGTALPIQ